MALVHNNVQYSVLNETHIGKVNAGHSVLLKDPQGGVTPYMVCKVGNTNVGHLPEDTTMLVNLITGRLVRKNKGVPCVLVSNVTEIEPFSGDE